MELGHENTRQLIGSTIIATETKFSVIVVNRKTASR